MQAMLGGSAQVAASSHDHALDLKAKGQSGSCFVNYLSIAGQSLVVCPAHAADVKSIADLKGHPVGVTAPGSGSDFLLGPLTKDSGLDREQFSLVDIGHGAAAVSQMAQGVVYAAMMAEPDISQLEARAGTKLTILSDLRTLAGTKKDLASSTYPTSCLNATKSWLSSNPGTAKKLAGAVVRALGWMKTKTAAEIAAKMPADIVGTDVALYTKALTASLPGFDTDGSIQLERAQAVLDLLKSNGAVPSSLDTSNAYTNSYLKQ